MPEILEVMLEEGVVGGVGLVVCDGHRSLETLNAERRMQNEEIEGASFGIFKPECRTQNEE